MTEEKLLDRIIQHAIRVDDWCKENGFTRIVTYLIGSWNYQLGEENSDVDTRSLVVPNFNTEILENKIIDGTTIFMPDNNEHCSILDVRKAINSYYKQSITALEGLFTPYWIVPTEFMYEFWFPLRDLREDICKVHPMDFINSTLGYIDSMISKYENDHNGKHLTHAFRARYMIERLMAGDYFEDVFDMSIERDFLLEIKHTKNIEILDSYRDLIKYWKEDNWIKSIEFFSHQIDSDRNSSVYAKVNELLLNLYRNIWFKN